MRLIMPWPALLWNLFVLAHPLPALAQSAGDPRSDSIDIVRTVIDLDLTAVPQLQARATLHVSALLPGVHGLTLDLQNLPVDSVWVDGQPVPFSYSSPTLSIAFPSAPAVGSNHTVTVRYDGQPVVDASGWGGFYFQSGHAYNLGVGFAADPHSFGRAWFPCFDNFIERCAFEIAATTPPDRPAWCGGLLLSDTLVAPGRRVRTWRLDEPIPSYLASVASGPYVPWQRTVNGIAVEIAAPAADTAKVTGTFVHLPEALACYQYWYGPFLWPRLGYALVPFNAGAMEHATNIAIMRSAIDGTTAFETLWAHELSHHWWGDLATCSTAEDMWLNEGWAVYSEHLITEWLYGPAAYRTAVEANFLDVLQNAHVEEGGYRAVSGVPHAYTYGKHVYNKGAVVAHNLRGYLGDTLFRQGVTAALEATTFDDWSSADLRDKLENATGMDLTSFFENWVFNPGFADISIDSLHTAPAPGGYQVTAFVRQKRRGAPAFFTAVPLEFTALDATHGRVFRQATVSGESDTASFVVPFVPEHLWVNTRQRLTLARAERERVLQAAGTYTFAPAKFEIKLDTALPDSALVRVEHHFAMPDTAGAANPTGYRLTNRYWTVAGDTLAPGAVGTVFYDGRGQADQLDAELFAETGPTEDSLALLYRPGPGHAWTEHPDYIQNTLGSASNRYGFFRFQLVAPGEYTIGRLPATVRTDEPTKGEAACTVTPNPVGAGGFSLRCSVPFARVRLVDSAGRQLGEWHWNTPQRDVWLPRDPSVPRGNYWLVISDLQQKIVARKAIFIP